MNNKFTVVRQLCSKMRDMDRWFLEDHLDELEAKGYTLVLCSSVLLKPFKQAGFKVTKVSSLD